MPHPAAISPRARAPLGRLLHPLRRMAARGVLLLLAVPFVATCGEPTSLPDSDPERPAATGAIRIEVVLDNAPLAGVTATLTGGGQPRALTTGTDGVALFQSVPVGTSAVGLTGLPADVEWTASSTSVTVQGDGTALARFSGTHVRTSAISGSVVVSGLGLGNVGIGLEGPDTASARTDEGGRFAFSWLRAGTYQVIVRDYDVSRYQFAAGAVTAEVAVGEEREVAFRGVLSGAPIAKLTLLPRTDTIRALGATTQLITQVLAADGSPLNGLPPVWRSSDTAVVEVDTAGVVTAVREGSAWVAAAAGSFSDSARMVVRQMPWSLSLSPDSLVAGQLGDTVEFTVSVADANGHPMSTSSVTWSVLDPLVAEAVGGGRVVVRTTGRTRVAASLAAVSDTVTLSLSQVLTRVTVQPAAQDMGVGQKVRAKLLGYGMTRSRWTLRSRHGRRTIRRWSRWTWMERSRL